ncbi:MAG TPA: hypothetical protein VE869_13230 [Gemmatimonas sp.]|nr:hypothetical protein [Gemmatimonas sp.]
MRLVQNALLCGIAAALCALAVYSQSNLFLYGDATRRGRHVIWDPAYFAGLALIAGLAIGALCAARWFAASPGKAALFGLVITVGSVGIVGGVTTLMRYRALPRDPMLAGGPMELEFELRLPADRTGSKRLPASGEFDSDGRRVNVVRFSPEASRIVDGRIVLPGRASLLLAVSPHLLTAEDGDDV